MANYFTKEEVVKSDFLFVSYKHENQETVVDTVNYLLGEGVRLWYDTDLVVGDKWSEIAEALIKHENCRGVIFFNSVAALMSEPIHKERTFARDRRKELAKSGATDRPFLCFPVNIGARTTLRLLRALFSNLPESDAEAARAFPLEYLRPITELFDSEVIYCYADPENDEYKARLLEHIAKALPSLIDKKALKLMPRGDAAATPVSLPFGLCKGAQTTMLPSYFLTKNQRAEYQNATYIVQDGHAYTAKKMSFRILYTEGNRVTLLSEDVVDVRCGGPDLNTWLAEEFPMTAFTEAERQDILEVRLLCEKDIKKTENPNALIFDLPGDVAETHFWIADISMGALQKVVKKNGTIYTSGYNFRTKKSGVRPVITLDKDALMRLL